MSCDLQLGFNASGSMWIPELQLAVADDGTADPEPDVAITSLEVTVAPPLDRVPGPTVDQWVTDIVLRDARALLSPEVRPDGPVVDRQLVPDLVSQWICPQSVLVQPDLILDLVHYRQAGGGASPRYTISGDLLYWPVEIEQRITSLIT